MSHPASPNVTHPNPSAIMQIGMGFWASKTVLTAINLDLFTRLAARPMGAAELRSALNLQSAPRHIFDFLDALVSLGFLQRAGLLEQAVYSNTPDTDFFLDRNKPSYLGGILEMANNRLYSRWNGLEESLRSGQSQNTTHFFEQLYQSPERLRDFLYGMRGIQMGNFGAFTQKFDFSPYQSLCDAGGALGDLCIQVAKHHPQMHCTLFDLPPVEALARENIAKTGLGNRVSSVAGDFFQDKLPKADVVVMGNILHDWDEEHKMLLFRKAYDALPAGGAFVAIENVIDNDRRQNTFGLLMSLNMLIEIGDPAFDYTFDDFNGWAKQTGFTRMELLPLAGPASAAIAYK